jgi:hypothetical protein
MFTACFALSTIPQLDTSAGTSFSGMFQSCYSLTTVPQLNMSSGTNFASIVSTTNIRRFEATGVKASISFDSCNLSRSALVEIFNNLATVTGQTITITGNPGTSLLTADDRSIATNKGWTISG